jgi:adenylosuccinate lyase
MAMTSATGDDFPEDGSQQPLFGHDTFLSPFTWRYGSVAMRELWSEQHKRLLMRQVWVALAAAQQRAGLVAAEQVEDLRRHAGEVDIGRSQAIERETRHDVMAELQAFAEQCSVGGSILHWGATSADITDNVDALRLRAAMILLIDRLRTLLALLVERIDAYAALPVMAFTHIQPAEPTTLGYRFAIYTQDLFDDLKALRDLHASLRGKGLKGAVGTQASFAELLPDDEDAVAALEADVMARLGLPYYPIATQTYTRQQDLRAMQVLAGIAGSLHKFALDFRLLQSPPFGEWAEPFGAKQVGSSAMPFKRNPIHTENICSLARYVAALQTTAWDNASQAILERSLDDSANRRLFFPGAFLAADEMLHRAIRVVDEMTVDEGAIRRNLARYGPFAASERVLMALVAGGASRQDGHEWIREASLKAWQAVQENLEENPLAALLAGDPRITRYLEPDRVVSLMDAGAYTGTAATRARALATTVREALSAPVAPESTG